MAETDFGKYKLIAELGHGGMADVFLAVQGGFSGSGFRKLTVVKRLRKNLATEPEFVAMLVDEAGIAARLNHANVVQTNEVGEHQGQYFIAMEYLDGQSLHIIQHRNDQLVKKGEAPLFTPEHQYVVILDVLAGLHHAHEMLDYDGKPLEIVHRDVTPHNVFVTYDGQVKVVDFGIAKAARRGSETRQGVLKGKVRYMAPEQTIGKNVDRRADIFAAGIMLWEVATGVRFWRDKDDLEVVQALVGGDLPRSPRSVNPAVSEALDAICVKALAQKASERYANAQEFRNELEQYLTDNGSLVPARRSLPATLDTLFKDKRAEIRQIIEKQLAALEEVPSEEFAAIAIPGSTSAFDEHTGGTMRSGDHEEEAEGEDQEEEEPQSRTPIFAAFAAALILAVLLVVGAVTLGLKSGKTTTTTPAVVEINVRINATPPTAMVSLDDGPAEVVPFGKTVQRDGRQHRIHIEAAGYQPKNDLVVFSQDVVLAFDLLKAEAPPVATVIASVGTAPAPPTHERPGVGVLTAKAHNPGTQPANTPTVATAAEPVPTAAPPPTATPTAATPVAVTPTAPAAAAVDVAADHRKAVNRAIRAHAGDVQGCFDRAKVSTPQLAGSVAVGASLAAGGSVTSAHVASSTVRGQGAGATLLEQCLVDRFKSWAFPAVPPGASSEVSYTFRFE